MEKTLCPEFDALCNHVNRTLTQDSTYDPNKSIADWLKHQATAQLAEEHTKAAVSAMKQRIIESQKHWFPWKITLTVTRR